MKTLTFLLLHFSIQLLFNTDHAYAKKNLKIAILDTGIDNTYREKIEKEISVRIQNPFYKIEGYNFAGLDFNTQDQHGHGTHIASIIHELAPTAELIIVKYYDPKIQKLDSQESLIRALNYAIEKNVDIINYSGGGASPDPSEEKLIVKAFKKGILVVAASGNNSRSIDRDAFYPASYSYDNILSVTASTVKKQILSAANFGKKNVHIAAPGDRIEAIGLNGRIAQMSGTSQATAFATGLAAQLWITRPDLSYKEIKNWLTSSADYQADFRKKSRTPAILNPQKSLHMQDRLRTPAGYRIKLSPKLKVDLSRHLSKILLDSNINSAENTEMKTRRFANESP